MDINSARLGTNWTRIVNKTIHDNELFYFVSEIDAEILKFFKGTQINFTSIYTSNK